MLNAQVSAGPNLEDLHVFAIMKLIVMTITSFRMLEPCNASRKMRDKAAFKGMRWRLSPGILDMR